MGADLVFVNVVGRCGDEDDEQEQVRDEEAEECWLERGREKK